VKHFKASNEMLAFFCWVRKSVSRETISLNLLSFLSFSANNYDNYSVVIVMT